MKCRSRNKAWLGAAITAATQIAGAGINYFQQRKANRKKLQQQYIADSLEMQNNIGENANNDLNNYYDRVELIPQFPYGGNTNLKPNIVRGGHAIDLGNNLYLMSGRKHSQGGIDIGNNPETGIEVEGNEVVQTTPSSLRVFSAQPILGGISPAEYILGGANPNKVFAAQENWKRVNNINDDGTRKAKFGKQDKNKGYIDENDKNFIGPLTPEKVKTKNNISKFYKDTFNNIASKYEDKYPNYAYFLRKAGEYYGDRMGENESNLIRYDNPEDIINIKGTKSSNVPVPKSLLDSLALNGAKTKVAPYIALGLANQESRFGYYPTAFYDARAMKAQREAIPEGEAMNKGAITPIEVLNDAAYGNNPYIDTLSYIAKKHKVGYLYNDSVQLPKLDLDDATLQKLEEDFIKGRKYADRMAAKFTKPGSVFEHAFNLYKSGKYNPGDPNYSSVIENAGRDAFSSPQIQEWWNKYGKKYYEQYAPDLVNSFKFGGKTYKGNSLSLQKRGREISTIEDVPVIEKGKYLSNDSKKYYSQFEDYNDYLTNNKLTEEQRKWSDRQADYYYNGSGIYQDYADLLDASESYEGKRSLYENEHQVPTGGKTYKLKSIVNGKPTNKHLLSIDENILNYIYDEAVRGNVDPRVAIALATNESNLGQARNKDGRLNAFDLYSYWRGTDSVIYPNSKTIEPYNYLLKKYKDLNESDRGLIKDLTKRYNYMSNRIHKYEGDNITADAVRYFLSGKYPGVNVDKERIDKYNKLVMSRFDELMNDDRFKSWYNSKNKKEFGGEKEIDMNKKVKVKDILSYLPVTGTFIDAHKLATEPSMENAFSFLTSLASDVTGYSILKSTARAAKSLKGVKKAAEISKNIPALGTSYLPNVILNRIDQTGWGRNKEEKKLGGDMDFNYIIGKNNIYKLGGRRKAPTGLGLYFPTTQDLHRGILYDRDGNPLFDTEITPSSIIADRVSARNVNGILYDENGNAKFDTDIEPSIVVADRVNKTPDLTSINKETDDYIANLNLDDDINIPNTSLNLDTGLKINPMRYKQRNRGYKSKDLKGDKVTFDRNEENRVVNPNGRIGSDEIGLGINLLGNLASSLINRATINSLDYGNAPTPLRAVKLRTRYNINPQLDNIREEVARGENDVTQNTASSKTALSRRQSLRGRGLQYANQLEGQRENIETELINRDRFNQQQIGNRNIERFNTWYRGLVDFENNRRNLRAENAVAGINNAADAIAGPQGYIARRERRLDNDMKLNRDLLDLRVLSLLNPNAKGILDPEIKKAFDEYERLLRRRRGTII